ncbi:MAG: gliding motility-associated C-terminal domain-containing protein [Bacteroidales bacterium]|nr:gliding motility-associated C-terminal domain-containing protein [Bacteroidales bacterium]
MSTLKDKFDNFAPEPDKRVWQSINDSLFRRAVLRRRRIVVASSAVAVTAVALFFALRSGGVDAQKELSAQNQLPHVEVVDNTVPSVVSNDGNEVVYSSRTEVEAVDSKQQSIITVTDDEVLSDAKETEVNTVDANTVTKPTVTVTDKSPVAVVDTKNVVKPVRTVENETSVDETAKEESVSPKITNNNDKVSNSELVVWIPTAISPDDPNNDDVRMFKVFPNSDANIISFEIYIYSRTGRLVYHSKDITRGWDGISNGKAQPMGTYVYIIELNDTQKGIQHTKGSFTLIR